VPADDTYGEVVIHANREFQRYAVENGVYFAPVDDVSGVLGLGGKGFVHLTEVI
jgi:hypothetical protein